MRKIVREEISRALLNKRFLIVFLLAGLSFAYGFSQVNILGNIAPLNAINAWQEILKRGYYGFFACITAVLPFADSLSVEKKEQMLNHFLLRSAYKEFIGAKFLAVALSGMAAVAIPAAVLLMLCFLIFPAEPLQIPTLVFNFAEMIPGSTITPGNTIELSSPGYMGLGLLFSGLFGACYAIVAMGISFLTKHSLIVFGIPFLYYSFGYYIIPTSRHLNVLVSTEAILIPGGNLSAALIQYCLLCLWWVVSFILFGKKERQVLN